VCIWDVVTGARVAELSTPGEVKALCFRRNRCVCMHAHQCFYCHSHPHKGMPCLQRAAAPSHKTENTQMGASWATLALCDVVWGEGYSPQGREHSNASKLGNAVAV
jgi:hypothetical protein